ncbi:hypothetical protein DFJ43DRAFT_215114 [Lentinula guzmanii]|uniref:Uncharacterized protein n=1 Tax=Lentinula guzmanii TaxID=2804957 RepID=A0AA38JBX8_9AGAR|nr:hypothetical protein DFJ43DRAFT_215114 [Lentinula guzmanii]
MSLFTDSDVRNTPAVPTTARICTGSGRCQTKLPTDYKWKSCDKCRLSARARKQKRTANKRPRDDDDDECLAPDHAPLNPAQRLYDSEGETRSALYVRYLSAEAMFKDLQRKIKEDHVEFGGEYTIPLDPLISDRERVQFTIREVWKTTGYRFTYVYK